MVISILKNYIKKLHFKYYFLRYLYIFDYGFAVKARLAGQIYKKNVKNCNNLTKNNKK